MLVKIFLQEIETNTVVRNAWAGLCREGMTNLKQYIDSQIAGGGLKPHNSEVTARCLLGIIFMFHYTRDVFKTSRIKQEEYIREALNSILRGIASS
jgi:hypothetical protein